ncbi:MAG: glycosyltransferase family 4 protein [Ktedonobacterales bacterium]|nr:glycosyltransferase family 4 protein [Ktedonobacterales bacterium]
MARWSLLGWIHGRAVATLASDSAAAAPRVTDAATAPEVTDAAVAAVSPRRLKIAVDAQCLQTARTGVRTYVDELLKRFAAPGVPHKIVMLSGPKRLPSSVRPFRIINQAVYFWWLHVWLPLRLWVGRYDVLFSPEYLTPMRAPAARVVTFHDTLFLRRPKDYNRLWLRLFHRVTLPAIRRAAAVITPSHHAAEDVAEYAGIEPRRIHAVPLGGPSDGQLIQVDAARAAETLVRYDVRSGHYLLHVGVLERRKNLVTLVRAFALWRQQGAPDDFKLVLVGQPGPRPDLDASRSIRQAISDLALERHVTLTGHVSSEERNALYTHAALVAIPSTFEGFGIPVLEAFAARVPVVVARATSLPEVAGDAALFFDPTRPEELAACFARLTGDAGMRATLIERGQARVADFTWERTAAETMRVFEQVARA